MNSPRKVYTSVLFLVQYQLPRKQKAVELNEMLV